MRLLKLTEHDELERRRLTLLVFLEIQKHAIVQWSLRAEFLPSQMFFCGVLTPACREHQNLAAAKFSFGLSSSSSQNERTLATADKIWGLEPAKNRCSLNVLYIVLCLWERERRHRRFHNRLVSIRGRLRACARVCMTLSSSPPLQCWREVLLKYRNLRKDTHTLVDNNQMPPKVQPAAMKWPHYLCTHTITHTHTLLFLAAGDLIICRWANQYSPLGVCLDQ